VTLIDRESSTPLGIDPWPVVYDSVNAWRGLIVHRFASAEAAISDTLLMMSQLPDNEAIRLEHLVGQRCQQLAHAISPDGPFSLIGASTVGTLTAFRDELGLRTLLCHGIARITIDQRGRWVMILDLLSFQSGKAYREQRVIDEAEARALQERISKLTQRLSSKLAEIRRKLEH
jgi:hypothetical protein